MKLRARFLRDVQGHAFHGGRPTPGKRCRHLQPDRPTQGKDDHSCSSVSNTRPTMRAAGRLCPDRPAARIGSSRADDWTQWWRAMTAIVVTDQAAGTAGMTLAERLEPQAAINDVVVQVHASGFVHTELAWPSTWGEIVQRVRDGRLR